MKKRHYFQLVLYVFLGASPFLPLFEDAWSRLQAPAAVAVATASLFAIHSAFFIFETAPQLEKIGGVSDDVKELAKTVTSSVKELAEKVSSPIKVMHSKDFYPDFEREVEKARSTVRIAYLATYPPQDARNSARNQYYDRMTKLLKSRCAKSDFHGRRLIRDTPKNRPWAADLLRALEKTPNVELALIADSGDENMPLALSAQIVDDKIAWLVAVATHENASGPRDVRVDDAEFAKCARIYYDRLWGKAKVILGSDGITEHGKELLAECNS